VSELWIALAESSLSERSCSFTLLVSNYVKLKTLADQTPCPTRELHKHMIISSWTRHKSNDSSSCIY